VQTPEKLAAEGKASVYVVYFKECRPTPGGAVNAGHTLAVISYKHDLDLLY
jgi:hypothetical protein